MKFYYFPCLNFFQSNTEHINNLPTGEQTNEFNSVFLLHSYNYNGRVCLELITIFILNSNKLISEVSNFGKEPQVPLRIDEELATNFTKQEEAPEVSDSLHTAPFGHVEWK